MGSEILMLELWRLVQNNKETMGVLLFNDTLVCFAIELPWKENKKNISRIPSGEYPIKKEPNHKKGKIFRLYDVPERDGVLIHSANIADELEGCIAPGLQIGKLKGENAVLASKAAVDVLYGLLPEDEKLIVKDLF